MKLQGIKHIMAAAVFTMATALVGQAHAFQYDEGDTVLAIWGNGTEALYNLSDQPGFGYGAAPQQLNVAAGLAAAGGANPVWFSLFSSNANAEKLTSGSNIPTAQVADPSIIFSQVANWALQSSFTGDTILAANENSFTSRIGGGAGADVARFLGGTWSTDMFGSFANVNDPTHPLGGSNVLRVFEFDAAGQRTIGHLRMSQAGLVEWQRDAFGGPPVPVPAAVWLFGTGLVGLAGLARRRRQAAESSRPSAVQLVM